MGETTFSTIVSMEGIQIFPFSKGGNDIFHHFLDEGYKIFPLF